MAPKIAVQLDDLRRLNQQWDNSLYLVRHALRQAWPIFYYQPKDLWWDGCDIFAHGAWLSLDNETVVAQEALTIPLSSMAAVLIRQDPPFNMGYFTNTLLLEKLQPQTLVLNSPTTMRNFPEKIWPTRFTEFMPPTMIAETLSPLLDFLAQQKKIVLKPLYWMGGKHIALIEHPSALGNELEKLLAITHAPVMAQKFLPNVKNGDKRVVMLDGQVAGSFVRGVRDGNFWTVGQEFALESLCDLTTRETTICAAIGAELKKYGVLYAGLDLIDEHLTEINITSPAGLLELSRYTQKDFAAEFWRLVFNKLASP